MPTSSGDHHHLALPPGTFLNEFRIERVLGSGGFGITYAAMDSQLQRKVAIKEFFPNDLATRLPSYEVTAQDPDRAKELARQLKRFLNEATLLAQLNHPNIVRVSRFMRANGTAYFVMEYLQGITARQYFARWETAYPPLADILHFLHPVLNGLESLHTQKLLHRDLKPDNILIVEGNKPVIIDLGVAKSSVPYSVTGEAFCTPGYSPFEQYQTHGDMGPWTDIYAVAATLHEIMTGELPPDAVRRSDKDTYVSLVHRLSEHYPPALLRAIDQALSTDVRNRPASVAKWRLALGSSPDRASPPLPPRLSPLDTSPVSRLLESFDLRYLAAAGILFIAAVALLWWAF